MKIDHMHNQVVILGVPVDNLTMDETLAKLERFIEIGRATGKAHQVATINLDFITNALGDPELMALLQMADLNMPDGMPVVWSARLLGVPIQERVAGVDTVLCLAERAAQKGYSLYLLGAAPGVAARAAEILRYKYPGLKIAGVSSPTIPSVCATDPSVIEQIKAARPDILLVAFGNPKQEKWIGEYSNQLQVPVMIGVGGTLDFISGEKLRAPRWMHHTGWEWAFRLAQEPKRLWRRYARNIFTFGPQFARQWWLLRVQRMPANTADVEEAALCGNTAVIIIPGALTDANLPQFKQTVLESLLMTPNILVDCSRTNFIDSSGLGALVNLARKARELNGDLALVGVSKQVARRLAVLRLNTFFAVYPDLQSAMLAHQVNRHTVSQRQEAVLFSENTLVEI
jgi:N-acetylglucosaminyldiphosphoundecaprenol N-acetyl-beta-D-mannosaminyltransferase